MFKQLYTRFLEAAPSRLHFAAHSHHYWPDVTRQAMLQYWDDSARHADDKWSGIFGEIIPRAQRHIAGVLRLDAPEQIVFAPSTHELVSRLLSCLETSRPARVLTTDSEFHSFRRQARRLREAGHIELEELPVEPIASFADRLVAAARREPRDLVLVSHVFFNSGRAIEDLADLIHRLPAGPLVVIDGYHGFCALPTDLGAIQDRIFYVAGGYKYAQAGEGACFMHVPRGCALRPLYTGWFASFGELESTTTGNIEYSNDGMRFAGSTFDPSGIYRFNAVMDLLEREGITIATIHAHVGRLQERFLRGVETLAHPLLSRGALLYQPGAAHGHFLTFVLPSADATADLARRLAAAEVVVDHRGDRLRFGFGLYQDEADVDALFQRMARALA